MILNKSEVILLKPRLVAFNELQRLYWQMIEMINKDVSYRNNMQIFHVPNYIERQKCKEIIILPLV